MMDGPRAVIAARDSIADGDSAGVAWSYSGRDLNANIVVWAAGGGVAEHRATEVDVLIVVLEGALVAQVEDRVHTLGQGDVIVIPLGCRRALTAGSEGVRYLTAHRRRGPLSVTHD